MVDSSTVPADSVKVGKDGAAVIDKHSTFAPKVYRRLLIAPLACALIALAHLAFGLRTQLPAPANWGGLSVAGYELVSRSQDGAKSGRHLSHGDIAHVDAVARETGKSAFSMTLVPVRTRTSTDLDLKYLNEHMAALALESATEEKQGRNEAPAPKVAIGTLKGRPALQTCITSNGAAAATSGDLSADIGNSRERGFKARLLQLAGLQPPARWECALVTIDVAASPSADQDLLTIWAQVQAGWRANPPWPVGAGRSD